MSARQGALQRLHKFFQLSPEAFERMSTEGVVEWAARTRTAGYKLNWREHAFLIGRAPVW